MLEAEDFGDGESSDGTVGRVDDEDLETIGHAGDEDLEAMGRAGDEDFEAMINTAQEYPRHLAIWEHKHTHCRGYNVCTSRQEADMYDA